MYITNVKVVRANKIIDNAFIKIQGKKIVKIGDMKSFINIDNEKVISGNGSYVLPGFIDEHIHGTNGSDVMDGSKKSLNNIGMSLIKEGVTSYLATTMTDEMSKIKDALVNINQYCSNYENPEGAELIGVHLEGPFISCKKTGGQNPDFIKKPDITLMDKLNVYSGNRIKLITYAPEETNIEFTKYLISEKIVPSAGHSVINYEQLKEHVDAGLSNVTHLFNAMSTVKHRNPGLAFAGLFSDKLNTELIVDGHHVDEEVVKFAFNNKGSSGITLITDSMRAKNCPDGNYIHGGMQVTKKEGTVRLPDGTLSGSVLNIPLAISNMIKFTECSLCDIVKMTSENPARKLNLFTKKGSITEGKDADLVLLNSNYELEKTFKFGKVVFEKLVADAI